MRIAVSAQGATLDAPASPVFGRCPSYLFVDGESMAFEALENPAMSQGGGAGIQAAQFVVNHGAQVVLTGNLGPNAFDVLAAAGVRAYLVPEGSVRQAVGAFQAGRLRPIEVASTTAHAGVQGGPGQGHLRACARPPQRVPGSRRPVPRSWRRCVRPYGTCAGNWPRQWKR